MLKGYSLVEVMIALVIFVGFVSAMTVISSTYRLWVLNDVITTRIYTIIENVYSKISIEDSSANLNIHKQIHGINVNLNIKGENDNTKKLLIYNYNFNIMGNKYNSTDTLRIE